MIWKILLEIFPFLWECFFGKKLNKGDPPIGSGGQGVKSPDKGEEEKASVKGLRTFIAKFNSSRKVAALVILTLAISLIFNYHLIGRVIAITRDEINKKPEVAPVSPTTTKQKEDVEYYDHLVTHLRTTYEE